MGSEQESLRSPSRVDLRLDWFIDRKTYQELFFLCYIYLDWEFSVLAVEIRLKNVDLERHLESACLIENLWLFSPESIPVYILEKGVFLNLFNTSLCSNSIGRVNL